MYKIISNTFFALSFTGILYLVGGLAFDAYTGDGDFSKVDSIFISHPYLVLLGVSFALAAAHVFAKMNASPTPVVRVQNTEGGIDAQLLFEKLDSIEGDIKTLQCGQLEFGKKQLKMGKLLWEIISDDDALPKDTQELLELNWVLPKATQDKKAEKAVNLKTGRTEIVK